MKNLMIAVTVVTPLAFSAFAETPEVGANRAFQTIQAVDDRHRTPIWEPHSANLREMLNDCSDGDHRCYNNVMAYAPPANGKKCSSFVEDNVVTPPENWTIAPDGRNAGNSPTEKIAGRFVPEPGFVPMFNGRDLSGWEGATNTYGVTKEGYLTCLQRDTKGGSGARNLWTAKEYADFVIRFDVKLPKDANNGLGIRTPPNGWCSHDGMEIQLLDDWSEAYTGVHASHAVHYSGAIYGVVPPARKVNGESYINRAGEWNTVEVTAKGPQITVVLNGTTVVDADVSKYSTTAACGPDRKKHPGLHNKKGRIHWCGHGFEFFVRNVRIKEL